MVDDRRNYKSTPPVLVERSGKLESGPLNALLQADVLIDDTARHFRRFQGRAILFSAPHNQAEKRYERVCGWADVRRLFFGRPSPRVELGWTHAEEAWPPANGG